MHNVPEICVSVCGAVVLAMLVVLPWMIRALRNAPDYVTVWPRERKS